jgi:hypothetical protein
MLDGSRATDAQSAGIEGTCSTIYVQNPRGGCPGVGSGSDVLVTRQVTNQICDGEIAQTVDLTSRVARGGCVFGPFVPYTKPR